MFDTSTAAQGYSPEDRLLSLAELGQLVGLKGTATKTLVRRPGFPPPVRLSQRVPRWWRSEVERWLETQRAPLQPNAGYCGSIPRRHARRHH